MKKYSVGYINGIFDMFHIGHLNVLKQAKELCDYLIVGISTDDLATVNNKKPIISFENRIEIVNAIRYVDEVIPQESNDNIDILKAHKVNVLCYDDNYKESKINDSAIKELNNINIDFVLIQNINGSSSKILKDILYNTKNTNSTDFRGEFL